MTKPKYGYVGVRLTPTSPKHKTKREIIRQEQFAKQFPYKSTFTHPVTGKRITCGHAETAKKAALLRDKTILFLGLESYIKLQILKKTKHV